jgi:indole-3-glycerol phosphate synthase
VRTSPSRNFAAAGEISPAKTGNGELESKTSKAINIAKPRFTREISISCVMFWLLEGKMHYLFIFCRMTMLFCNLSSYFSKNKRFSQSPSLVLKFKLCLSKLMKFLQKIVENKRGEIAAAKLAQPIETLREVCEPSSRDFRAALQGGRRERLPRLIAEIKRVSPSQGVILTGLKVTELVKIYNESAAAISVLTDQKFFGGSLEDLDEASGVTRIPLLRKDFILDEYQLLEARMFGADAVLLIARILEIEELENLLAQARKLGLDCLVEVHDEADLQKVLQTSAEIIGVNNRNLDTLAIDLNTTFSLVNKIPQEKIIVSESGISTREDLEKLSGKVDVVLMGTALLQGKSIEGKLIELVK